MRKVVGLESRFRKTAVCVNPVRSSKSCGFGTIRSTLWVWKAARFRNGYTGTLWPPAPFSFTLHDRNPGDQSDTT